MSNLDSLVQRLAPILAEIDGLGKEKLESFANSPLPEDAVSSENRKAWKLLYGLVRTRNIGGSDLPVSVWRPNKSDFIPSPPGLFSLDLLPLPEGGFDRKEVIKWPVVGWEIDPEGDAKPVIPGMPMGDRWAVLAPTGFVIVDYYTGLGCPSGRSLAFKDWIKGEIEWAAEGEVETMEFWTASEKAFEFSGPLPRAVWFMMEGRREWVGTPVETLQALSRFRDPTDMTGRLPGRPPGRPSRPASLGAVLDTKAQEQLQAAGVPEETLAALSRFRDPTDMKVPVPRRPLDLVPRRPRGWRPSPPNIVAYADVRGREAKAEVLEKLRALDVPEELLEKLEAFFDDPDFAVREYGAPPVWPSGPASLVEDLQELQLALAGVGLLVDHLDDGRLRIIRV